jgi:hypothetical protein
MAQAGKPDIAFDFGCGAWDNDGIQNLIYRGVGGIAKG